jgi:foldase protein PrsA
MKKTNSSRRKKRNSGRTSGKENTQSPPTLILSIIAFVIVAVVILLVFQDTIFSQKEIVKKNVDPVVASVNGKEILKSTIDKQYDLLPDYMKQQVDIELILNKTIEEQVLSDVAKSEGIKANDQEIKDLIDTLMYQNGITDELLEEQLKANNMTREELNEVYREQIRITKLLNKSVLSKITITDAEMISYYERNKANSTLINIPETVRASHILVDTKEEAEEVLNILNNNGSFATLAKERSKDTGSSAQGGDLGYFPRGVMVTEFEETSFSMDVSDEPQIVETQFGFHIIDVTGKKEAYIKDFEEVSNMIKQTLIMEKQQIAVIEFIQQKKDEATIIVYFENLYGTTADPLPKGVTSFVDTGEEICRNSEGKPIVRMFTTETCPHCVWATPIIDPILKERMAEGDIISEHWYLDRQDDSLTEEFEGKIPTEVMQHLMKHNSNGFVPFYSVGCKYIRIGNGHEGEINAEVFERNEFNSIIDAIVTPVEITIE